MSEHEPVDGVTSWGQITILKRDGNLCCFSSGKGECEELADGLLHVFKSIIENGHKLVESEASDG